VDVIVTIGDGTTRAAKEATQTIPIVFVVGDPVGLGFAVSLARPGANLTGVAVLSRDLDAKRLQLLKEGYPKMSRVLIFANVLQPPEYIKGAEDAARAVGVQPQIAKTRGPEDFDTVLRGVSGGDGTGILVLPSPFLHQHRKALVDAVSRRRFPAMYEDRGFIDAGGLMSYGPSLKDLNRRVAVYVDKILRGAKPADLPIEQPTKFELVINLKTAKALGLTIPHSLLLRADQVIE
jgi:putative ABC transport system substrate-binding protein